MQPEKEHSNLSLHRPWLDNAQLQLQGFPYLISYTILQRTENGAQRRCGTAVFPISPSCTQGFIRLEDIQTTLQDQRQGISCTDSAARQTLQEKGTYYLLLSGETVHTIPLLSILAYRVDKQPRVFFNFIFIIFFLSRPVKE